MREENRYEKREITWRSDDGTAAFRGFEVTRWRDNNAGAGIKCRVLKYADSGGHEYAEFDFSGPEYESKAREFLAALDAACDDNCNLRTPPKGADAK